MIPYEILIRGNPDGTFRGAHAIDYINGLPGTPRPVTEADFPSFAKDVNSATLVKLSEAELAVSTAKAETKAVQDKLDSATALYEKAKAALQSGDVDALKAIHAEVEKPAVQRDIEAIDAQIADLQQKQKDLASKL